MQSIIHIVRQLNINNLVLDFVNFHIITFKASRNCGQNYSLDSLELMTN